MDKAAADAKAVMDTAGLAAKKLIDQAALDSADIISKAELATQAIMKKAAEDAKAVTDTAGTEAETARKAILKQADLDAENVKRAAEEAAKFVTNDAALAAKTLTDQAVIDAKAITDKAILEAAALKDAIHRDTGMNSVSLNGNTAIIAAGDPDNAQRTYKLMTTQDQRNTNKSKLLDITERTDRPTIRTGSPMFDGLFAMAIQEAGDMTVTQIKDSSYNSGNAMTCGGTMGCFQSGQAWTYVWTRDTAYAIDLGLAQIDPQVSKNSLLFKLSMHRDAARTGLTEIVQDTGSGGSWPVSTDRVVWARAAWELLKYLDGEERTTFLRQAYTAIRNTVDNDRIAVFDSRDGLYRGESSFTDWREQTYPAWTATNVVHIAMSKTLSTNVNFWKILDVAARMAEELKEEKSKHPEDQELQDLSAYEKQADMAASLKIAINKI
jgi:hypothetical protein